MICTTRTRGESTLNLLQPQIKTRQKSRNATLVQYWLSDAEELDVEKERSVGWDFGRPAPCAVGEVAGNGELPLAADLHRHQPFVPTFDHLADADAKVCGRAAVGTVKRSSIFERAGVVDNHGLASSRTWSIADLKINILQSRRSSDFSVCRIRAMRDDINDCTASNQQDQGDRADAKILILRTKRLCARIRRRI